MKSFIWLSFDLGVRGDYEGMYQFLDVRNAKECGDSVGVLLYEYTGNLLEHLKKELKKSIEFNKRSRVYVIYYDKDEGKQKGRFIIGRRKAPPWAGFGPSKGEEEDVGE